MCKSYVTYCATLVCFFAFVFGQTQDNCTQLVSIYESRPHLFDVAWGLMPGYSYNIPPGGQCGSKYCSWIQRFSCLTSELIPINCTVAKEHMIFPLCAGRALVDAHCTSWDCCKELNKYIWTYLGSQWQSISVAKNYEMIFFSDSHPIKCENYSPPGGVLS